MRSLEIQSEQETRTLTISLDEEDARFCGDFAQGLAEDYIATAAAVFREMLTEDGGKRS